MTFNFNSLPDTAGPSFRETGQQIITLTEADLGVSKNSGREQITAKFETQEGTWIFEYYQVSESPFMMYKLRQLLIATGIAQNLQGQDVSLKDVAKMLPRGVQVEAVLKENDRGYGEIDYSDKNGGYGIRPIQTQQVQQPNQNVQQQPAQNFQQQQPTQNVQPNQNVQQPNQPANPETPESLQQTVNKLNVNDNDFESFNQPVGGATNNKLDSEFANELDLQIIKEDEF